MYPRAYAEAIGKARELRKTLYDIADIVALKHNLTNKQRLRLREELVSKMVKNV